MMYQLVADIRTGKVRLNNVEMEKETKKCYFFKTRTTDCCIYRFEKERVGLVEERFGTYYIFFTDLEYYEQAKKVLIDTINEKYRQMESALEIVRASINNLYKLEVNDEHKEAK